MFTYEFVGVPPDLEQSVRNDVMVRESIERMGGTGIRLEQIPEGWHSPPAHSDQAWRIHVLGQSAGNDPLGFNRYQVYVYLGGEWIIRQGAPI